MLAPPTPKPLAVLGIVLSLLAFLIPDPAIAQPSANLIQVPDSVDPSGETDVTSQLQALFDRVHEGQTIRFGSGARYRIERPLSLDYGRWVTIDGNGATLVTTSRGNRTRSHLRVRGGNDIVVRDLTIVGPHPTSGADGEGYVAELEAQMGIDLLGVTRAEISNVEVRDVYGDFLYIGRGIRGQWSESIWIHDNRFDGNGRQGVAVTAGRDIVIERNVFRNVARAAIDLEPNTPEWGVENVHILDNTIGTGRLLFLASHGNGPVNNVVVANNRIADNRKFNISVEAPTGTRRSGFWILNNQSTPSTPEMNLNFRRVDNVVISGNTIDVTEDPPEITMPSSCGTATQNDFGSLEVTIDAPSCSNLQTDPPPRPEVGVIDQPEPLPAATITATASTIPAPQPQPSLTTPPPTVAAETPVPVIVELDDRADETTAWRRLGLPGLAMASAAGLIAFAYRRRRAMAES